MSDLSSENLKQLLSTLLLYISIYSVLSDQANNMPCKAMTSYLELAHRIIVLVEC